MFSRSVIDYGKGLIVTLSVRQPLDCIVTSFLQDSDKFHTKLTELSMSSGLPVDFFNWIWMLLSSLRKMFRSMVIPECLYMTLQKKESGEIEYQ